MQCSRLSYSVDVQTRTGWSNISRNLGLKQQYLLQTKTIALVLNFENWKENNRQPLTCCSLISGWRSNILAYNVKTLWDSACWTTYCDTLSFVDTEPCCWLLELFWREKTISRLVVFNTMCLQVQPSQLSPTQVAHSVLHNYALQVYRQNVHDKN